MKRFCIAVAIVDLILFLIAFAMHAEIRNILAVGVMAIIMYQLAILVAISEK